MVGVGVVYGILERCNDLVPVRRHVVGELDRVLSEVFANPTDGRLMDQHVGDIRRLPLGMVSCPRREPVLFACYRILWCDGALGGVVESWTSIGKQDGRSRIVTPQHLAQHAREPRYHSSHALANLTPPIIHDPAHGTVYAPLEGLLNSDGEELFLDPPAPPDFNIEVVITFGDPVWRNSLCTTASSRREK